MLPAPSTRLLFQQNLIGIKWLMPVLYSCLQPDYVKAPQYLMLAHMAIIGLEMDIMNIHVLIVGITMILIVPMPLTNVRKDALSV